MELLEGAAVAGSVWPGSQLLLGQAGMDSLPWTHGELQGTRQGDVKELQERPFGFEDTTFLLLAFLRSFSFGLEYELSVSPACILVKSSQICEKPYRGVS